MNDYIVLVYSKVNSQYKTTLFVRATSKKQVVKKIKQNYRQKDIGCDIYETADLDNFRELKWECG